MNISDKMMVSVVYSKYNSSGRIEDWGTKEYYYWVPKSWNVNVFDFLVTNPRNNEYSVVRVIEVEGFTALQRAKCTKWAVQKIDTTEHQKRMKMETVAQEIKAKLQQRKEEYEERMIYERLASEDPEIKALLARLDDIESGKLLLEESK
jgi:hypothetical protein